MFQERTTFIVGAGASADVKIPVGKNLKHEISKLIDIRYRYGHEKISGDDLIDQCIKNISEYSNGNVHEYNKYLNSSQKFIKAIDNVSSIDAFIDAHSNDVHLTKIAKLGIAKAIIDAESNSIFLSRKAQEQVTIDIKRVNAADTWYKHFFHMLKDGIRVENIDDIFNNVSIICFNYDRCIEEYLYQSLQTYFAISSNEAANLIEKLNIIHPYGTVGKLDWQIKDGNGVSFGSGVDANMLLSASNSISTFGEQISDENLMHRIHSTMLSSTKVVFLGFGFHLQNLKLISPQKACVINSIFATTDGFSDIEIPAISQRIYNCLQNGSIRPNFLQSNCSKLFEVFPFSLSD